MRILIIVLFFSFFLAEASNRDVWQKPELVFNSISFSNDSEKTFCEIGPGSGYFTLKAAQRFKKVYAADIDEKSMEKLRQFAKKKGIENISLHKAKYDDPLFPEGKCDIIFMGMLYHHLEKRVEYLKNLKKYLTPKGKIVNLDNMVDEKKYHGTGKRLPDLGCRFSKQKFLKELKLARFSVSKDHQIIPFQYLVEFQ